MLYKWQLATLIFLYVEIKHDLCTFFVDYVNFTHNLGANILLFSRGHKQAKHFTQVCAHTETKVVNLVPNKARTMFSNSYFVNRWAPWKVWV